MGLLKRRIIEAMEPKEEPPMARDVLEALRSLLAHRTEDLGCYEFVLEAWMESAANEIERLRNERRWISVEERLPEEDQNVLVFDQNCHGTHIAWCHTDSTGEIVWASQVYYGLKPTHWMPLPAPPTELGSDARN